MDAGRRRRWVFHLLAERSNRVVVRAPVTCRSRSALSSHNFVAGASQVSTAGSDCVGGTFRGRIRIEPAGFSGRSVMAIEPSLDLLKARAYRWKQAFGGLR